MIHQFVKGNSKHTLVMLHGTGGNEFDLIPIAKMINPDANILSPRGNVNEHGMNRFFKRLGFGIFDLESLALETKNLFDFISEKAIAYDFDLAFTTVIGYSNGANILANMLLTYDVNFKHAIMMHSMVPNQSYKIIEKPKTRCLITIGDYDQMIDPKEGVKLANLLRILEYPIETIHLKQGHEVTKTEIESIKSWYEKEPN